MARKSAVKKVVSNKIELDVIESNQLIPFPSEPEKTPKGLYGSVPKEWVNEKVVEGKLVEREYQPSPEEMIFALESFISYRPVLKSPKKISRQGGIKVLCNGNPFKTLVDAMISTGKYDLVETQLRTSHWNQIRKGIKNSGVFTYRGDEYESLI